MLRFKSIIFYQNSSEIKLFLKKNAKFSSARGSASRPPLASRCRGSTSRPQTRPPIVNLWLRTWQLCTIFNYMRFCSFCFEQFFLHRSVTNLMMLIIDACLMLDCFVFEKFYLHYALRDFDSIL